MKWRASEPDVLPLWVAEMDVMLAPAILEVLGQALDRGDTGYAYGTAYAEAYASFAAERWGFAGFEVARSALVPDVMLGAVELLKLVTRGRRRGRGHPAGVPALLRLCRASRPPGRRGAVDGGLPPGSPRPRQHLRGGRLKGAGRLSSLQPTQPDRYRPYGRRVGRGGGRRRSYRRARGGRRDPRPPGAARRDLHVLPRGGGRKSRVGAGVGVQGLESARLEGGRRLRRTRTPPRTWPGCPKK